MEAEDGGIWSGSWATVGNGRGRGEEEKEGWMEEVEVTCGIYKMKLDRWEVHQPASCALRNSST